MAEGSMNYTFIFKITTTSVIDIHPV